MPIIYQGVFGLFVTCCLATVSFYIERVRPSHSGDNLEKPSLKYHTPSFLVTSFLNTFKLSATVFIWLFFTMAYNVGI